MDRDQFHQLLKDYLEGTCDEEERLIVENWYNLLGQDNNWNPNPQILPELEKALWEKIQDQVQLSSPIKKIGWWKYAAAAIVLLASTLIFYYQSGSLKQINLSDELEGFKTINNRGTSIDTILLPDNSRVILNPGSILRFPVSFAKERREVQLEGIAFFDVTKRSAQPFLVITNEVVTQVLGTSFEVKEMSDKGTVEVSVKTGKVSVYQRTGSSINSANKSKGNGVILEPNQKARFFLKEQHFITEIADNPQPVGLVDFKSKINFNYSEEPLKKVLRDLETVYRIRVELEDETIENCPFTGQLDEDELFNNLEIICTALGIQYEKQGLKILLKGKGCSN